MTRTRLATISKFALALLWLGLFTATHLPPGPHLTQIEANDKIEHFLAYAALAFTLATTWELAVGTLTLRHLAFAWVAVLAYGAFDEITQIPVGRDCSFWDWVADAAGSATGLLVFLAARRVLGPWLLAREKM